jgi:AcrR family transcriptional regulator
LAQVKKEAVRAAIVKAAYRLFRRQGYVGTTLNEIAEAAGISRANIYVYFGSKFELLYALFEPWLQQRLEALERELQAIADPRARLRRILVALWREIPAESNGFANNLMQAVSTAPPDENYSPEVLLKVEARVAAMIDRCLDDDVRRLVDSRALAQLAFMAFDGFAMQAHLRTGEACTDALIDGMCAVLAPGREAKSDAA